MEVVDHVKVAEGTKEFCGPCRVRNGGVEGSVLPRGSRLIGLGFIGSRLEAP